MEQSKRMWLMRNKVPLLELSGWYSSAKFTDEGLKHGRSIRLRVIPRSMTPPQVLQCVVNAFVDTGLPVRSTQISIATDENDVVIDVTLTEPITTKVLKTLIEEDPAEV